MTLTTLAARLLADIVVAMDTLPRLVQYPESSLSKKSTAVVNFDNRLNELISTLYKCLKHYGGIGLSAPQIDITQRICVVHVPDDDFGPKSYINPEIIHKSGYALVEESCLSIPGIVGSVFRASKIVVSAQNLEGEKYQAVLHGMHAVCLQHEIDHMDGKLFIDRLFWLRRFFIRQRLKKQPAAA